VSYFWKLVCAASLTLAVLAVGCDLTGQYDKKFNEALQEQAKKAKFESNLHSVYTDVVDTSRQPVGVKLRLPKVLDSTSKSELIDIAKAMAKSPIPVPGAASGSAYTISRTLDAPDGSKQVFGVAMMAMPRTADLKAEALQSMMAKGMATVFPSSNLSDVTVPTPTGGTTTLKRLRVDMSVPIPGGKAGAKLENRMDYYIIDAGKNLVMITWSAAKSLVDQYKLDEAIEASMGTLEVTAPPEPPAGKAKAGCF